jgi:hypothetical protein
LSRSRFVELSSELLNVLASPYKAVQLLVVTDHCGDLWDGDDSRSFREQVLDEGELAR